MPDNSFFGVILAPQYLGSFLLLKKSSLNSFLFKVFIAEHVAQRNISIVCDFIVQFENTRARMVGETAKGPKLSPINFCSHS